MWTIVFIAYFQPLYLYFRMPYKDFYLVGLS